MAAELFPAGFGALPEPCFRSGLRAVSAAGLPAGWIGVPGAGRVPRRRRERDGRVDGSADSCGGFCSGLRAGFGSAFRALLGAGFGSALRAGFCAAFCAGFRAGVADCRAANSGTAPSTGITSPVSF